ncbi:MAG: N-acetyltransferase family protein [Acetobacteraceae bacterium]
MTSVTIRAARREDVPDLMRLIRGLAEYEKLRHKAVATEDDYRTAFFGPSPSAHALLAEAGDGALIGIAVYYYTFNTFAGRRSIFLEDLFVELAHRGAGVGLALLRHLARQAVAENCVRIDWWVLNWNEPSIAFYERIGATRMTDWQVRQLEGQALMALAEGARNG